MFLFKAMKSQLVSFDTYTIKDDVEDVRNSEFDPHHESYVLFYFSLFKLLY